MATPDLERKALNMLKLLEGSGRPVARIVIEGRKMEFEFVAGEAKDEFDAIDMRHGKA